MRPKNFLKILGNIQPFLLRGLNVFFLHPAHIRALLLIPIIHFRGTRNRELGDLRKLGGHGGGMLNETIHNLILSQPHFAMQ